MFFKVHLIHYLPFVLVFHKSVFFNLNFGSFFYLKLLFFIIAIEEAQLKLERKGEKTVTLRSVSRLPVGSRFASCFLHIVSYI